MNKEKLLLVLGAAVLAGGLIWIGFSLNKPGTVINQVGEKLGAVANVRDMGPEIGQNGLQTIVSAGDMLNATTTLVSLINPFPATSTVSFIGLFNTGVATSSYTIDCGSYDYASAARTSSNPVSPVTMTADVASSSIFSQSFRTPTSTITIKKSGYLLCVAHGILVADATLGSDTTGWWNAFNNANNTFTGKYWVEFRGLIQ